MIFVSAFGMFEIMILLCMAIVLMAAILFITALVKSNRRQHDGKR